MWIGIEYAYPEAAPTFRDSGATSAKPYPDLGAWNAVQPQEDGAYRWGPIDRFVKAFQEAGFRHLTLMLRDESPWASVDPPKPPIHRGDTTVKPEYEADFSAYVQAYVERYDADGTDDMPGLLYPVLLYGFEPEFSTYVPGDAESYIHMAGLAYAAVKRANPEAQMMNAALLLATIFDAYPTADEVARRLADPDPRVFDKSPADIALVLDHPELFDILDVHALADYTEIIPTVAWLRQEMARRGYDRPIWIGDTWGGTTLNGYGPASCPGGPNTSILAYPATEADRCEVAAALSALADSKDPDHDEAIRWIRAESAAGTVRKIMVAAGEGLAGINMGNVEDWEPLMLLTLGGAGTSPWQGMLDRNMLTKTLIGIRPSFYALQQVATLLKESTRVERVAGYDEKTYVYAVELADGRSAYVVWADVGLWLPGQPMPTRPVRLTIPGASGADVEWTITEGDTPRRESLPLTQNVVELHVGSAPAFLYPVDGSS
ncbi:MAG TPA: hypothetical protein VLD63_07445 [Anaerolineales bacterium]|nr:hypothetical protein [Anaerolineales bacterium]